MAKLNPVAVAKTPANKTPLAKGDAADALKSRQSKELIVALSGPVGCALVDVKNTLESCLIERGYEVVHVKVSDLMMATLAAGEFDAIETDAPDVEGFSRIWRLQTLGNDLRSRLGQDVGAQLAIKQIALDRTGKNPGVPIAKIETKRVAYVIDQLKHPKEVVLLRSLYGDIFYMIGVLASYETRRRNLSAVIPKREDLVAALMDRDRRESEKSGQQLDKTLQYAEFFVNNSKPTANERETSIKRFLGLIHGDNGLTPTAKERGMFAAQTASLRSACLSRQVGAAILDSNGNLMATGCNDVPRAGGGLYEAGAGDMRCVSIGDRICHNDKHKNFLRNEVIKVLLGEGIELQKATEVADKIREDTRIKDLIEFSRAVHAEMDAIVSVARAGGGRLANSVMFTTTYPCHSCARHIVASGVKLVYFIEPYEKSLADDLHHDSIAQDPQTEPRWDRLQDEEKVSFMHFDGVAPHSFTKLFQSSGSRKNDQGVALPKIILADKRVTEFLDDYKVLEARVVERFQEIAKG